MQMTKFITREVDDVSITSVEDIIIFFARNFGERQYYGFRLIRYDLIEWMNEWMSDGWHHSLAIASDILQHPRNDVRKMSDKHFFGIYSINYHIKNQESIDRFELMVG